MSNQQKIIAIKNIVITNFKGIRDLQVNFAEGVTNIFGDNATGKTTVSDAVMWLLFDKDSSNATAFNIKPLASDGTTAQKGVEPTVQAVYEIDGRQVELQKIYKEIWTTKRGKADKEFGGHETKYYIDGVPKKKSEYGAYINSIVPEDVFRMITDVTYFNRTMRWQDRQRVLLDICGDISDADVIYSNEKLQPLMKAMGSYSIDDFKKKLAADRARVNKDREMLPVRIDEAHRSIVEGVDVKTEMGQMGTIDAQIAFLEAQNDIAHSADTLADEKNKIDAEAFDLRSKNERYIAERRAEFDKANTETFKQRSELQGQISRTRIETDSTVRVIGQCEASIAGMKAEFSKISSMEWDGDSVCPTCKQALPEGDVKASVTAFRIEKSKQLEKNNADGKAIAERMNEQKQKLEQLKKQETELAATLAQLPPEVAFVPEDMPEYAAQTDDIQARKQKLFLKQREQSEQDTVAKNSIEISALKSSKEVHRANIAKAENNKVQLERIAELEKRERELSKQIEEIDSQIFLTEDFTKEKVRMMESKINSTFKLARFKLFGEQVNGGVSECCEATYEGVPYRDLNNAMRVNVGIDIVNSLSRHYGVCAPLIVDNAESVTNVIDADGQMIRLVVSGADLALRVEAA